MKISIVLGLGFGDEAKGSTVNGLCYNPYGSVVVRFNGGHQVGHTVFFNGIRHPFSNFGSGTLRGTPTYWSEFCTVNPMGVKKEGDVLREMGIEPEVYYHPNAMVTTPFDIFQNITDDKNKQHGTVGVGFGKTIQRNEDHYHLYVRDLFYPTIRDEKLRLLADWYYGHDVNESKWGKVLADFKLACDDFIERYDIVDDLNYFGDMHFIFEGGQGIMLDMDYGFFPHVTRSNTTSKNAIALIKTINDYQDYEINTYYVTRAYQTRHGNGFMSNGNMDISYIEINPNETNKNDGAQGVFRRAVLDFDQLKYAMSCDKIHNPNSKRHLVISCLDHIKTPTGNIPITKHGNLLCLEPRVIGNWLSVDNLYQSTSEEGINFYDFFKQKV
jgi:adenylosuccinate synthase